MADIKAGSKTSEWKAMLGGILAVVIGAVVSFVPQLLPTMDKSGLGYLLLSIAFMVSTYAISRGWVKAAASRADAAAILANPSAPSSADRE